MKRHKLNNPVSKRGAGSFSTHGWKRTASRKKRRHSA